MPMRLLDRLTSPRLALRAPSRTIRLRLTLLYAGLFLASGIGLLSITYVLVRHATDDTLVGTHGNGDSFVISEKSKTGTGTATVDGPMKVTATASGVSGRRAQTLIDGGPADLTEAQLEAQFKRDRALAVRQHDAEMHQLLEQSGVALAFMTAFSILLGWLAAGRVLRPLRTINQRAREISASNLHRRLGLTGPDDEVTQLANTFDDLLGRLEASFSAQRQFVANASHELRTPLARAQTLAEVALSDPGATVESLRASHERVLAAGKQQERLVESLLTLARSERGLDEHEVFELASLTDAVLDSRYQEAERHGLRLHAALDPAVVAGNAALAERLVTNLVDNAIRHNTPGGRIDVETATTPAGEAVLVVSNTGPVVRAADVDRLFQPFQRLGAERTGQGAGIGLGLSIVAAIAAAHGASVSTRAHDGGGLRIAVAFPAREEVTVRPVALELRRERTRTRRLLGVRRA
jgi:signal transduction histidine kinase